MLQYLATREMLYKTITNYQICSTAPVKNNDEL
jgi:hypothetical protein